MTTLTNKQLYDECFWQLTRTVQTEWPTLRVKWVADLEKTNNQDLIKRATEMFDLVANKIEVHDEFVQGIRNERCHGL